MWNCWPISMLLKHCFGSYYIQICTWQRSNWVECPQSSVPAPTNGLPARGRQHSLKHVRARRVEVRKTRDGAVSWVQCLPPGGAGRGLCGNKGDKGEVDPRKMENNNVSPPSSLPPCLLPLLPPENTMTLAKVPWQVSDLNISALWPQFRDSIRCSCGL